MAFWDRLFRKAVRDRRNTPGAVSRDLTPDQRGVGEDAYRVVVSEAGAGQASSAGISQGNGADWFGPLNPLNPVAPPEVTGRRYDFWSGLNLQIQPRALEAVSFPQLRALADAYDILRSVIETRKDQMEKLGWAIKPRALANGDPAMNPDDPVLEEITDFLQRPDGEHDWGQWLRAVLEDMFVIDAVSLYAQRTRSGKLMSLEQLDGATIKPVIDDWGRTPKAPIVAYQQVLKGFPAINYTTDNLIYLPRNYRAHKVYGFSHVEQVITTINIGLRRESFQLSYYSEGNIPEALVGVPEEWTPPQIAQFQEAWDAMLAGNDAARRKIKFIPGGVAKTYLPTKEPELTGKMDEWLARVVCYVFSVSPQPFVAQMNRATAETAHDQALEEGLAPVQHYVKRLADKIVRMGWPNVKAEFAWTDDREVDQAAQETIISGYVTNGIKTINEGRDELGLPPVEGGDELKVKTATGYVPVDAPPPEPAPMPGAPQPGAPVAGGAPQGDQAPKPKSAAPKPKKGAQPAEKAAPGFRSRENSYWSPHPPHAPNAGSRAAGGEPRRAAR